MAPQFFALRVESHRVVAAEIPDKSAAALLDAAQPILLATPDSLAKFARKLQKPLVLISRTPARDIPWRNPAAVSAAASSPTRSSSITDRWRTQPAAVRVA